MRIPRRTWPIASWVFLLGAAVASHAAPVHISVERERGTEVGAGISVGKGSECFVVAPAHVVDDPEGSDPVKSIRVTDQAGKRAKATVLKAILDFDAALLKVKGGDGIQCPEDWVTGRESVKQAEAAEFLVSNRTDGNGRMVKRRLFVSGASKDLLDLEPFDKKNRLAEGDSGSSLYAGTHLVGMVLSVDTATGEVQAITQRHLHALFGADVLPDVVTSMTVKPFTRNRRPDDYATLAAQNAVAAHGRFAFVEPLTPPPNQRYQRDTGPLANVAPGVTYVMIGEIVDVTFKQTPNPDYKPPKTAAQQKAKKKNNKDKSFGDMLLGNMSKTAKGKQKKNKTDRYFFDYNVDVKVELHDLSRQTVHRNIERLSFRSSDQNANRKELEKNAIEQGVAQAVALSLNKFGLASR